ncbi:MAG: hypothetical protein ABI718_06450 [Acidobacteriota bacterium]
MTTIRMAVPEGFRFAATVQSHGWVQLAPFEWDAGTEALHRTETLADLTVDLEIRFDGSLQVQSAQSIGPLEKELRARLRRMFQLDLDLNEFHAMCRRSVTHRVVARAGFGRLLCGSTRFEDAVKVIATTNTTWAQTKRMVRLLVDRCGAASPGGRPGFPTPEGIAVLTPEILQRDCRLGYRAGYIHALATAVASGKTSLDGLAAPESPSAELFDRFRSLPGIGPYGAAHLLAMEGRHDFIAVDTEFRRFVRQRYHGGRPVLDSTMLRRYSKWGRWQYLAYWSELWSADR